MRCQRLPFRLLAVLALLILAFAAAACSQNAGGDASAGQTAPASAEQPAATEEKPAEPEYTSWVVNIADEDSYEQGGMTFNVAVNITATNPTADVAGAYTGSATAHTTTTGDVGGAQLNADAVANSSKLEFKLDDPAGPELAQLTPDSWKLTGKGSIVMKAAGTASVGPASGGFSNTSGQNLDIAVDGAKVTLKVDISGHTYTFHGTISGK